MVQEGGEKNSRGPLSPPVPYFPRLCCFRVFTKGKPLYICTQTSENKLLNKRLSMKYVCVEDVRRGLSSADILWTKGFLHKRTSHFLVQKTSDFSKFIVCPNGQGEVEPVRTFCRQRERGQSFVVWCGRLLWTALNYYQLQKIAQINKGNVQIS